jgi:hypothetical protein
MVPKWEFPIRPGLSGEASTVFRPTRSQRRAARARQAERMLALPAAIAPELEGVSRLTIRSKLDAAVREVLMMLSKGGQDDD